MTLTSNIKVIVRTTLSLKQFEPDFDLSDGMVTGNKKVLSSDLENVGQGHHLQKSLYVSYYANDLYQTYINTMTMWPATKISYQLT